MATRDGQRGQAAVLALLVMAGVLAATALLYNSGRVVLTKMHLQNTADSAAYSAALMQARDYNFSAYANRSMVANQVGIAQMVGLRSWSRYYCTTFNDRCGGQSNPNNWPTQLQSLVSSSVSGLYETPLLKGYGVISSALYSAIRAAAPAGITEADAVNQAFSRASQIFHDGILAEIAGASTAGAIHQVVKANDPQASVTAFGNGLLLNAVRTAQNFTKPYSQQSELARFATPMLNGLDAFSRGRSSQETPPFPLLNPAAFYLNIDNIDQPYAWVGVNYGGGTELQSSFKSWSAMDVSTIQGFNWLTITTPYFTGPIPIMSTSPILYYFNRPTMSRAAAMTGTSNTNVLSPYNNQGPGQNLQSFGGVYQSLPGPARQQEAAGAGSAIGTYSGLLPYQDVAATNLSDFSAPVITLLLKRPNATIRTTDQIGVDSGALATQPASAAGQVEAIASAAAQFVRPQSSRTLNGRIVYGNLFTPYWEPHLVPTPTDTRTAAEAAQMGGAG